MSGDSDSINVNVLVSAKDEYTNILKTLIGPLIHSGFEQMYTDAIRTEPRYTLKKFQEFCKETQRWNQFMIDNEVAKVKETYDWIYDLITAIFVINVKILTSIRLGGDSKNINIKMPSLEKFIHKVYISSAERFYYNPYLVQYVETFEDPKIHQKKEECLEIIESSIDEAIKDLLPVQYILQEYLAKVMEESENGSEEGSENGSNSGSDAEGDAINGDGEEVGSEPDFDPAEEGSDGELNPEMNAGEDAEEDNGCDNNDPYGEGTGNIIGSGSDSDSDHGNENNGNKFGSQFRNEPAQVPISNNYVPPPQPAVPQTVPAFAPPPAQAVTQMPPQDIQNGNPQLTTSAIQPNQSNQPTFF